MNLNNTMIWVGVMMVVAGAILFVLGLQFEKRENEPLFRALIVNKWEGRNWGQPVVVGTTVLPAAQTETWNLSLLGYGDRDGKNTMRVVQVSQKYYDSVLIGQILE